MYIVKQLKTVDNVLFILSDLNKVKYLLHISLEKRNFAGIIKFIPHRE